MAYGHAERNLAAIRQLEAETRELLSGAPQLGRGRSCSGFRPPWRGLSPRFRRFPPAVAGRQPEQSRSASSATQPRSASRFSFGRGPSAFALSVLSPAAVAICTARSGRLASSSTSSRSR
jgi:hypothetical protein